MNESNLISDGIQLMLVGMGMVFVFLSLLVIVISIMKKFLSEPMIESIPDTNNFRDNNLRNNNVISDQEIAAISSAVHAYRQKYSKK
ncbi:OadG family protein [Aliikangiella coralliicola]|uniref:Probable oxaloacetate decarboxylase gamma chain n=1 Tax=Aliikangiella coralliicola TaxID=2592383 RepID=A0A545U0H2_9GAMM|nr:OadG family transporter subunit [Aliikangiella coralliicola]TQV82964.1 hypothetical protein FLL46_24650 [Aliikangiella coralliicola]